jgi:hypothetical protein
MLALVILVTVHIAECKHTKFWPVRLSCLQLAELHASTTILSVICLLTITCGNINTFIACRNCDTAQSNILLIDENCIQIKVSFNTSHPRSEMQPVFLATFSKCTQYQILNKTSADPNEEFADLNNVEFLLAMWFSASTGAEMCGHSQSFNFLSRPNT